MLGNSFRPWGLLDWVLDRTPNVKWSVLGCLSPEDRCLGMVLGLEDRNCIHSIQFLEIIDPPSDHSKLSETKRKENAKVFNKINNSQKTIKKHDLLEGSNLIVDEIEEFISLSNGNIILDISAFPKRFFFPFVKFLLKSRKVKNFLVTYAVPQKYSRDDIAGSPDPWAYIPLFISEKYPEEKTDVAIIGVGFLPFGLPDLLRDKYKELSVNLFFPFPPPPPPPPRASKLSKNMGFC